MTSLVLLSPLFPYMLCLASLYPKSIWCHW